MRILSTSKIVHCSIAEAAQLEDEARNDAQCSGTEITFEAATRGEWGECGDVPGDQYAYQTILALDPASGGVVVFIYGKRYMLYPGAGASVRVEIVRREEAR